MEGMDVVNAICDVDVNPTTSKPIKPVTMQTVEIVDQK
jgi:hypothetical protein